MRRFLQAIVICLAALPTAALAQWNRPIPQDPARQEQRRKEMLEWNRKTLVGAYDQVGHKNPRWDEPARECLEAAARYFSYVVEPYTTYLDVYNGAKQALNAGCDDPMILYLYARSSGGAYYPGKEELARRFTTASAALERSGYPRIRRFAALYKAGHCKAEVAGGAAEAERLLMASLRLVAESAERDEWSRDLEDSRYTAVETIQNVLGKLKKNSFAAFQQIDAELAKTPALEVLRLQAKGDFYIEYAWEARGTGFADTVSPQNWEKFEARLKIARKALGEAWLAKPGDFHTANLMLVIAKGLNFSRAEMEKWFDRAMVADGDNQEACELKLEWLDPKWHGTQEELLAFGRACRDTKNWHTGITLLIGHAHLIVYWRLPSGPARQKYMSSPEVQNDIVSVYREYLRNYPGNNTERSRYAVLCYYCGHYEESHLHFLHLGNNLDWSWGIKEQAIKEIRDIVAKEANLKPPQNPKTTTTTAEKPPPGVPPKSAAKTKPPIPEVAKPLGTSAEFTEEKFRYTLPGPQWSWAVRPVEGMLCTAVNQLGFTLSIGVVKLPKPMPLDEKSAKELENGYFASAGGQFKKRGGRFTTFQGLRCYQIEAVHVDGRTSAARFFAANGLLYNIFASGGEDPVEDNPEFEKILNGFEFTEPPVAPPGNNKKPNVTLAYRLGELLGSIMIAAIVIAFVVKLARGKSRSELKPLDAPRSRSPFSAPGEPASDPTAQWQAEDSARQAAVARYRKGMKDVGRGLIALGILHLVIAGVALLAISFNLFLGIFMAFVLGGVASIYLVLGILALNMFNWVNYVVAVWSSFVLAVNFLSLASDQSIPARGIGLVISFLVYGSLLYFSVKNVRLVAKAREFRVPDRAELG